MSEPIEQSDLNPIKTIAVARRNCKRCFGRGYSGRKVLTGYLVRCSCVKVVEAKE